MQNITLIAELERELELKGAELSQAESLHHKLLLEYNSIQNTLRMISETCGNKDTQIPNCSKSS